MKRFVFAVASFVLASSVAADAASAQLPGNPVYALVPQTGITLNGDFGRGIKGGDSRWTLYYGGRLEAGFPLASFWVGGGLYDSEVRGADKEVTLGGGAAVHFLKARSLPVALSLQVGGGTVSCGDGCRVYNGIAGPALKINVVGAADVVHPWIMPRFQVTRFKIPGGSLNQIGFGGSAGLTVNLPFGLGFHGVADYSMFEETSSGALLAEKRAPFVVGGGIHYTVWFPGFGVL